MPWLQKIPVHFFWCVSQSSAFMSSEKLAKRKNTFSTYFLETHFVVVVVRLLPSCGRDYVRNVCRVSIWGMRYVAVYSTIMNCAGCKTEMKTHTHREHAKLGIHFSSLSRDVFASSLEFVFVRRCEEPTAKSVETDSERTENEVENVLNWNFRVKYKQLRRGDGMVTWDFDWKNSTRIYPKKKKIFLNCHAEKCYQRHRTNYLFDIWFFTACSRRDISIFHSTHPVCVILAILIVSLRGISPLEIAAMLRDGWRVIRFANSSTNDRADSKRYDSVSLFRLVPLIDLFWIRCAPMQLTVSQ